MTPVVASAPAKVILFGEHGVNRGQPAIAAAVDLHVYCRLEPRADGIFRLCSGQRSEEVDRTGLLAYKAKIDALRASGSVDELRPSTRGDFYSPARYVLGHLVELADLPGAGIEWRSSVPAGSGLGSGAAASCALACAYLHAAGHPARATAMAYIAWQGDVIAHGGVASGLDSGACALGGIILYTLEDGPRPLPRGTTLPLVIGDTLVRADTAAVNAGVRERLASHPERLGVFPEMGTLARQALKALEAGDLLKLGCLMNLNQRLLERLGVSSPELDRLIGAALEAGALGAKLSGSGGGGIMIALTRTGQEVEVAQAIEEAGGRSYVLAAGVPGARIEPTPEWNDDDQ